MKTTVRILAIIIVLITNQVLAQQDLNGTWQGKLALGGDATLTVQFIMTKAADGSWTAIVNSPDTGGIKNVKANAVSYDGTNLKIDVAELSGGYKGALKDGKFEGTWTQAGSDLPLNISPYVKPVMAQADIDALVGEWVGKLAIPAGELTLVFRFEKNAQGEVQGFVRSPDQGGNEMPAADILLNAGEFSMKVPSVRAELTGHMADNKFMGKFKQGPQPLDLTMNKGQYEPPKAIINLSKEAMAKLAGEWHGELETPMGSLTSVIRFETKATGETVVYQDLPDQGRFDVPLLEASLVGDTVTLKAPGPGAAFTGKLEGDQITGQIPGPMGNSPITLKRGKYVAPAYNLNLPAAVMQQLHGKWTGKLAGPQQTLTLVFRFETQADGKQYGFIDSPDQGANGLKIIESSMAGDELTIKTKFPRAEFKGKLSGGELNGNWMQMGGAVPLAMKKG